MTYAEYVTALKMLLVIDSESNANYVAILPRMIEYAENRIYRELDLVNQVTEGTQAAVAGTRTLVVPASIQIVQSACVLSPAAATLTTGKRNPLQRVSLEFLNFIWPTLGTLGLPLYYAMQTDTIVALAPTPDAAYLFAAVGPVRPAPLAVGTPTTWLSLNIPDLFIAASMVFGTGWQRDFGAQSDNPQASVSWETQYQTLMASADVQDARRKAQSASWQPFMPEPLAKESRT